MTQEQPIVLKCQNPLCDAPNQQFVQIHADQYHCTPACRKRKNAAIKRARDKQKAADIVKELRQIIADKDEKIASQDQKIAEQEAEIQELKSQLERRS